MRICDFLEHLKKKYLIIILSVIVFMIAGFIYSWVVEKPIYECTDTLAVEINRCKHSEIDYDNILISQSLAKTYSGILKTEYFSGLVASELKLPMNARELRSHIRINMIEVTYLIEIKAQTKNACLSEKIAEGFANEIVSYSKCIMKVDKIKIIGQDAKRTIKHSYVLIISLGALIGFLIGVLISLIPMNMKIFKKCKEKCNK